MPIDPDLIEVRKLYTSSEAASILGVSEQTIRRLIKSGHFKAKKQRGKWLIPGAELKKDVVS